MMTFRNCDRRWPFLWETARQPAARWHADGDGPVQYLADTPDGAWAEFLRHEEIDDEIDLMGVSRALWCIEADTTSAVEPDLPISVMTGDQTTYSTCQAEARRLRDAGQDAIVAPSAALVPKAANGSRVEGGFREGPPRDGRVFVLFGPRPVLVGWLAVDAGRPPVELLARVRPFA
jgi:hypothetical protein